MSLCKFERLWTVSQLASNAIAELEYTLRIVTTAQLHRRESKEVKRLGTSIICPRSLNSLICTSLVEKGWRSQVPVNHGKMTVDFAKNGVLVEVQFGKYAYCAENIFAKFPLAMRNSSLAEVCVIVVPTNKMAAQMSTGIGTFEQVMRNYVTPLETQINYNLVMLGIEESSPPPQPVSNAEIRLCIPDDPMAV